MEAQDTCSLNDTKVKCNLFLDPRHKPNFLLLAALWYAEQGYAVFPLLSGTKEPATQHGLNDATTDARQIRYWWAKNPDYNIGINCGMSGLLVVDLDTYKKNHNDAWRLADADLDTIRVKTARGGIHLWYQMPQGKQYGNRRGTLPKWIDIKGHGGYVVAPPSIFYEDERELPYSFVLNHSVEDRQPTALPAALVDVLEAAQKPKSGATSVFSGKDIPAPDLSRWRLSRAILEAIHAAPVKGTRSEIDMRVVVALVYAGASNDEIRAVFQHYPIGTQGKYAERSQGDRYLALTLANAQGYVAEHPRYIQQSQEITQRRRQLAHAMVIIQTKPFTDLLRAARIRRTEGYRCTLHRLLEIAYRCGKLHLMVTTRQLHELTGVSAMGISRHLKVLAGLYPGGLCLFDAKTDETGSEIDLTRFLEWCLTVTPLQEEVTTPTATACDKSVTVSDPLAECAYAQHRCDDAFASYPYQYALKRRATPPDQVHGHLHLVLAESFGPSGLLIWATLHRYGELTTSEIAEITGLTRNNVRTILRKLRQAGLLVVHEGRCPKYELHPNAEERLDERRPHMVTAGLGILRVLHNAESRIDYLDHQLHMDAKLQPQHRMDAKQRASCLNRREQALKTSQHLYTALAALGINPHARVQNRLPKPKLLRVDPAVEWERHKRVYEEFAELRAAGNSERECYRLMSYGGYTREEIQAARRMAQKVGQEHRVFRGVESQ